MIHNRALPLAICFALIAIGTTAHAEEESDSPWSVGGGLRTNDLRLLPGLGGLGGLGGLTAVPQATLLTEVQLSPGSALMFGVSGSFTSTQNDEIDRTDLSLSAEVGVRFGLTESSPVEVSIFGAIFGSTISTETVNGSETTEFSSSGGGVRVGFVFERELTEGLALRLSTPLVTVRADVTKGIGEDEGDTTAVGADLIFQPSLEVRMSF